MLALKWFNPPVTAFIQSELSGAKFISILPEKVEQKWVNIESISPSVILAVIASEDQKFFDHWGFDVEQIQKAIDENNSRRSPRGASTITQQTAKNLFLWQSKGILRKGLEAFYTFLIELFWSKERIVEVYLNIAEMGRGVYGIEAASKFHFGKSCKKLNRRESAFIAALLPRPKRYTITNQSSYFNRRIESILAQMESLGGEDYVKGNLDLY